MAEEAKDGEKPAEKTTKILPGGVTQEQIDAWKKKEGEIYAITVTDSNKKEYTYWCSQCTERR